MILQLNQYFENEALISQSSYKMKVY